MTRARVVGFRGQACEYRKPEPEASKRQARGAMQHIKKWSSWFAIPANQNESVPTDLHDSAPRGLNR